MPTIDFPRMTIPYRGDKYTGKSQKIFGQYVYELDRKVKGVPGKLYWTHTMPSTAAQQGIIPLAPAAPEDQYFIMRYQSAVAAGLTDTDKVMYYKDKLDQMGIPVPPTPATPETGLTGISTVFPRMIRFANLSDTYKAKFGDLANALSPENLHCDGEISHVQAQLKKKKLMAEWRKLEKEVGFPVDIEMLQ